jgi:hypothetical protein
LFRAGAFSPFLSTSPFGGRSGSSIPVDGWSPKYFPIGSNPLDGPIFGGGLICSSSQVRPVAARYSLAAFVAEARPGKCRRRCGNHP